MFACSQLMVFAVAVAVAIKMIVKIFILYNSVLKSIICLKLCNGIIEACVIF